MVARKQSPQPVPKQSANVTSDTQLQMRIAHINKQYNTVTANSVKAKAYYIDRIRHQFLASKKPA
jgi:hypothetical protein